MEIQWNIIKQVKDINKIVQDLKKERKTIQKIQREALLEMENLGKRTVTTKVNITKTIQEIQEKKRFPR